MGLFMAKIFLMFKKGEDIKIVKWRALTMLVSLVVISLFPGISFFGHLGGLASGFLIGLTALSWGDKDLQQFKVMELASQ